MIQSGGVITVPVRDHDCIETFEIDAEPPEIPLEDPRVVASVEQDSFAAVLDQRCKPPVPLETRRSTKRIVENGDLLCRLRFGSGHRNKKQNNDDVSASRLHALAP
jgi:hypothetical protein